jgi:hypothetical protein
MVVLFLLMMFSWYSGGQVCCSCWVLGWRGVVQLRGENLGHRILTIFSIPWIQSRRRRIFNPTRRLPQHHPPSACPQTLRYPIRTTAILALACPRCFCRRSPGAATSEFRQQLRRVSPTKVSYTGSFFFS